MSTDLESRRHVRTAGVLLCWTLAWTAPLIAEAAPEPDLSHAEQLSIFNAPAALQLLDKLQPTADSGDTLAQWLMVRGLACIDGDPEQAQAIIRRLYRLGQTQPSAEAAAHVVQAVVYVRSNQLDLAEAEVNRIGTAAMLPAFERFRLEAVRGAVERLRGRNETAASIYERLLDFANAMHSSWRAFYAMEQLSIMYFSTGNLERAASLARRMRVIAEQAGDDLLWTEALNVESDIADARGDRAARLHALLEALPHARRADSDRVMSLELLNLGDSYLKSGDYTAALDYSIQALAVARRMRRSWIERIANFRIGIAQIGLGAVAQGKQLVDGAIQQSLSGGDLANTNTMMHEYLEVLEKAGDLRGALEVVHQDDEVRKRLMATSRQKILLELSAKFDDERRARQIELLERDNTIKSRDLQAQRLRQQMIVMAAALIAVACGALAWGICRIRHANERWVHNSQRDVLTGLLNRRHFNEHILTQHGDRPYVGCLLLISVDRLQCVNDLFGHAAGDAVLTALGNRLSSVLRDAEALVRWNGKDFLAMLGPMSEAQLNRLVRQLLNIAPSEPVTWNGHSRRCTVSIGYASFPMGGAAVDLSLDRAITLAGKALQQAKRQGRDRACLIQLVNADSEQELSAINMRFEEAAAQHRVRLVETRGAAG